MADVKLSTQPKPRPLRRRCMRGLNDWHAFCSRRKPNCRTLDATNITSRFLEGVSLWAHLARAKGIRHHQVPGIVIGACLTTAHKSLPLQLSPPMPPTFDAAYGPAAPHRLSYVLGEAFEPQGHLVEGGDAGASVLPPPPRLQSFLHLYHENMRESGVKVTPKRRRDGQRGVNQKETQTLAPRGVWFGMPKRLCEGWVSIRLTDSAPHKWCCGTPKLPV